MTFTRTSKLLVGAALAATLIALTGCASTATVAETPANVLVAAQATPELSTFTKLIKQAGLSSQLEGPSPVTVFAPSDEAFKAVPQATMDKLAKNPDLLKATLAYHVVPGLVKAADIPANGTLVTSTGAKMGVSRAGDFVAVDDGLVIKADQAAGNGIIHTVDRVLTPPKK